MKIKSINEFEEFLFSKYSKDEIKTEIKSGEILNVNAVRSALDGIEPLILNEIEEISGDFTISFDSSFPRIELRGLKTFNRECIAKYRWWTLEGPKIILENISRKEINGWSNDFLFGYYIILLNKNIRSSHKYHRIVNSLPIEDIKQILNYNYMYFNVFLGQAFHGNSNIDIIRGEDKKLINKKYKELLKNRTYTPPNRIRCQSIDLSIDNHICLAERFLWEKKSDKYYAIFGII